MLSAPGLGTYTLERAHTMDRVRLVCACLWLHAHVVCFKVVLHVRISCNTLKNKWQLSTPRIIGLILQLETITIFHCCPRAYKTKRK